MGAPSLGDVAEAPEDKPPLMVDLFCGPNLPLGKAFLYCGWRCLPVDWALDPSHDLSNPQRQDSIREQLQDAVFAAAALDCSTKSRAREIPRDLGDGKPGPRPLRSDRYPEGLPDLPMADQLRVSKDNLAASSGPSSRPWQTGVGAAFGKIRCVVSIGS